MVTREQRRAQTVPVIARIARSQDFRSAFGKIGGITARHLTIIPTLPDDSMGYVFDRLSESGSFAVVALVDKQECRLALISPVPRGGLATAVDEENQAHIHSDSPVGMFFDLLVQARTIVIGQATATLVTPGDVRFNL